MRFEFIEKLPRLLHRIGRDYGEYSRDGSSLLNYEGEAELPALEAEGTLPVSYIYEGEAELSGLDADGDLLVGYIYHFSDDPTFEFNEFHYIYTGEYIYWNLLQAEGSLSHNYLMQGEAALQELSANGRTGMQGEAALRLYPQAEGSLHTDFIFDGTAVLPSLQTTARLQRHWQGQAEIPRLQSLGQTGKSGKAEIERLKASALFSQYGHGKATLQSFGVRGSLGVSGQAEVQPLSAKGAYRRKISFYGAAELQPISIQGSLVYDRIFSGQAAFRPLRASGLGDFSSRLMTGAAALPHITADGQGFTGKNYHGLAELRQLLVEGKLTMIWQAESMQGEATLLPIQGQGMTDGSTGPLHGEAELPGLTVEWPRLTTKTDFHSLQYKRFRQWQSWISR